MVTDVQHGCKDMAQAAGAADGSCPLGTHGSPSPKRAFTSSEAEFLNEAYDAYAAWKGWNGAMDPTARQEMYAQEVRRAQLRPGARILEIGFGDADFLVWSRNVGFCPVGIEIVPAFVDAARQQGFRVWCGDVRELGPQIEDRFDAVVLFDVLEHLTKSEIVDHLRLYHTLLNADGILLARFPNAASPFGYVLQHGDLTHRTALSVLAMEQLAAMTGYKMIYGGNAARSYRGGLRPGRAWLKHIAYCLRDLLEICLGGLYFSRRLALDLNTTVVLRRAHSGVDRETAPRSKTR